MLPLTAFVLSRFKMLEKGK